MLGDSEQADAVNYIKRVTPKAKFKAFKHASSTDTCDIRSVMPAVCSMNLRYVLRTGNNAMLAVEETISLVSARNLETATVSITQILFSCKQKL